MKEQGSCWSMPLMQKTLPQEMSFQDLLSKEISAGSGCGPNKDYINLTFRTS